MTTIETQPSCNRSVSLLPRQTDGEITVVDGVGFGLVVQGQGIKRGIEERANIPVESGLIFFHGGEVVTAGYDYLLREITLT